MGHLLTVQNILALLGGPINIDREDYPWQIDLRENAKHGRE
jgi:hypothetical protein